ncbi:hypothetical protein C8R43DRAFT_869904 [Mycena crocata]|nr:hypothetical protein C8R43DRAFT_869904 [Mycena crocata]
MDPKTSPSRFFIDDACASDSSEPVTPVSPTSSGGRDRDEPSNEKYHPYGQEKRKPRKKWNHALEKPLFNILELTTLGGPNRRPIYIASLEAHIDRLHVQLAGLGIQSVPMHELESLKGLNAKTCRAMVTGLQNDLSNAHERLLKLQRSVSETLVAHTASRRNWSIL